MPKQQQEKKRKSAQNDSASSWLVSSLLSTALFSASNAVKRARAPRSSTLLHHVQKPFNAARAPLLGDPHHVQPLVHAAWAIKRKTLA
jgi:hypothetical protein